VTAPALRWLRVAALLAGVWAAFMLLASLAAIIPAVAQGGNVVPMIVPLVLAVVSGAGAWGIRAARSPYHHLALGAAASWVAFLFMVPLRFSMIGIAVNMLVAGIVATSWRRFR
jgi:hypothetical protein